MEAPYLTFVLVPLQHENAIPVEIFVKHNAFLIRKRQIILYRMIQNLQILQLRKQNNITNILPQFNIDARKYPFSFRKSQWGLDLVNTEDVQPVQSLSPEAP